MKMKVTKFFIIIVLFNALFVLDINSHNNGIDTLSLFFDGHDFIQSNPHNNTIINEVQDSSIIDVISMDSTSFVLILSGKTDKYSIRVYSESAYTMTLNGINMTTNQRPLIQSLSHGLVSIELAHGTYNSFIDQAKIIDSTSLFKGCIESQGQLSFTGQGYLKIQSKTKHGIYSKGDILLKNGTYNITTNNKDGIHTNNGITIEDGSLNVSTRDGDCFESDGPFAMNGGDVSMIVLGTANDGIKCRDSLVINCGEIKAIGYGVKKMKKQKVNVSSILKCTDDVIIKGGDVHIIDYSEGGESIHAGKDVLISGGNISVINNGFGGFVDNGTEKPISALTGKYYTSKCIEAKNNVIITGGKVNCLATGTGGKGIVGQEWVVFGVKNDKSFSPTVNVITLGNTLWNDTINDKRYGCPKGIRAGDRMYIYNGSINVRTRGVGGEGLESRNSLFVYGGETMCDTYDDGINAANKFHIWDGMIFTKSINNDGIDSNGRLTIEGGTIVALSKHIWGESFDADDSIVVKGGVVLGIGRSKVKVSSQSLPIYNTIGNWDNTSQAMRTNIKIASGDYIHLITDDNLLLSLKNDVDMENAFLTVCIPPSNNNSRCVIYSSTAALNPNNVLYNKEITIGGQCPAERTTIVFIKP